MLIDQASRRLDLVRAIGWVTRQLDQMRSDLFVMGSTAESAGLQATR